MAWPLSFAAPLLIGAAAISAAIAWLGWQRRQSPGVSVFAAMMLAVALWALSYAFELSSRELAGALFWAKVQYIGIANIPLAWFIFALQYTGHGRLFTARTLPALFVIPLLTLALVATNEWHRLIWSSVQWHPANAIPLSVAHGAAFWLHAANSYLLLLVGTLALVIALLRRPQLYRGQAFSLLVSALTPWLSNVIYLLGFSPFSDLDLTPFAFTITGSAMAFGLFRFQLLDRAPVTRDLVIERMRDGVMMLDEAGRIIDINPAARTLLRVGADSAIGRSIETAVANWPIELGQVDSEALAEVAVGEDAAQRTFEVRVAALQSWRGRPSGWLVSSHEITERKRAEAELRRHDAILDAVRFAAEVFLRDPSWFDSVPGVLARLGQATNVSRVYIFEQQENDGTGLRIKQLHEWNAPAIPPHFRQPDAQSVTLDAIGFAAWETLLRSGSLIGGPVSMLPGSGHDLLDSNGIRSILLVPIFAGATWWGFIGFDDCWNERAWMASERDVLTAAAGIIGTAIERSRLSDQVTKSEQRFRTLVANVPGAIYRCADAVNPLDLYISDAISAITGYTSDQLVSRQSEQYAAIIHPDDHALIERTLSDATRFSLEYRMLHADGTVRWVRELGQKIFDANGNLRWLDGIIFDITDQKQTEHTLAVAKEAAEAASRAKSTFLANMSHELRTPLTSIIGYGDLLELIIQQQGHTDLLPDLAKLRKAARQLLGLISDVLDLSKIEAGKLELFVEEVDAAVLLHEVTTTVQPLVQQKGNRLEVQGLFDIGVAHFDSMKVRQILLNLLSNAAKFTSGGTLTLAVGRYCEDANDWIWFSVSDTGIGLSAEQIAQLFQPFTQLTHSTAQLYGGTGLGLALSQRFCQLMGGTISVVSKPGVGSTFTLRLPDMTSTAAAQGDALVR